MVALYIEKCMYYLRDTYRGCKNKCKLHIKSSLLSPGPLQEDWQEKWPGTHTLTAYVLVRIWVHKQIYCVTYSHHTGMWSTRAQNTEGLSGR